MTTAETRFEAMLDAFQPEIADMARESIARLRQLIPPANEMVYDSYNALAIGFSSTQKTGDAVLSIAIYPRIVYLFFLQATRIPGFEVEALLEGSGSAVRRIPLTSASVLDRADVQALIGAAIDCAKTAFPEDATRTFYIRSVSATQRPRRPNRI